METLASLKEVREFFGIDLKDFRAEWTVLDEESKREIREGIGNGSFTY
ncbi:hypothetical protein [Streptomyces sp. SID13726]|nr:hypothetical protein [Streptomyces sp. SID13726]NEB04524.1 hypothetical protein [Streptomyces sp. SID13726]